MKKQISKKYILRSILVFSMAGFFFQETSLAKDMAEKVVIQYDCIPNYANWGGVTAAYQKKTGVRIPPDMKGSSAAMAALEAEKENPLADCAYYSGGIGFQAAEKGLHQAYKPKGWDKIPEGLKDSEGKWWTVHSAHIAILVNTKALGDIPVPKSLHDLLDPKYKGLIVYDDPTIMGTGFTFVYGVNTLLGGSANFDSGFAYLKKLDVNILKYAKESAYNDLMRGEIPIWINADGNGLKAKNVDKSPIEVVIPSEGTIVMPLVMGMVNGAPHPEETKKYLDWLLTEEAQKIMAESFFIPILKMNLGDQFLPASAYVKAQALPLAEMAAKGDEIKARWVKEIRK